MGRPYETELEQLPDTYRWAAQAPIERLVACLRAASSLPLVAVGSGGSFTTAEYAATFHRELTGTLASAMTPLEAAATGLDLRSAAVLLATAGGKNPDVLGGFRQLALREPRRFVVMCMNVGTPLARQAARFPSVDRIELDVPSGRDGFLATNSLLASVILLSRGYAAASGSDVALPADFDSLLGVPSGVEDATHFDRSFGHLWEKDTLIVLHGPATRAAAIDLESKFTEAALGNVQTADYRHFAHGRHHWLAKHPATTAVLALVTPEDEPTATRTLDLLPRAIPAARIDLPSRGVLAGIAALAHVLHIAGSAGRARGIDPGKPGVPGFGRSIYHLKAFTEDTQHPEDMPAEEAAAIERKAGRSTKTLADQGGLQFWREAYSRFVRQLSAGPVQGVVLDYDGTLCGEANRFDDLTAEVRRELSRLLRAGFPLGIATGRGKSVRKALRDAVPKKYWGRVVIGYYNGGDVGRLDDDSRPDGTEGVTDSLLEIKAALESHPLLPGIACFEPRLPQISIHPRPGTSAETVWALLQQLVYGLGIPGVLVLRSSHSMDVLAPGVSKKAVVARVAELIGGDQAPSVLCIGDRGRWPGNDFFLLNAPHALSVDEVSPDPETCWNLAPPGQCGVQAALGYLARLRPDRKGVHFRPAVGGGRRR